MTLFLLSGTINKSIEAENKDAGLNLHYLSTLDIALRLRWLRRFKWRIYLANEDAQKSSSLGMLYWMGGELDLVPIV